jgi:hypothetical protein
VKAPDIGTSAVTGPKIRNGDVANVDLDADAVNSANVVNEALTASDLATDSVQATEIADDSIDSGEIADNSLLSGDIASGAIGSAEIGSSAVGVDEIASAAVGSSEIASSAVGGAEIASNAVTGGDVANEGLTQADLNGADSNGTITVGAGLANGTCVDLNLNVPGADAGEAAVLSMRDDVPAGMVIYGVGVLVDDQVVAKACNFTGAASPAINQAPIRLLTFD